MIIFAKDRKRSWRKERGTENHRLAVSDGGRRVHCSACGWALGIVFGIVEIRTTGCCRWVLGPTTEFLAGALSLEHSTLELETLIISFVGPRLLPDQFLALKMYPSRFSVVAGFHLEYVFGRLVVVFSVWGGYAFGGVWWWGRGRSCVRGVRLALGWFFVGVL